MRRISFAETSRYPELIPSLQQGGVLILPTDTLYGFAVDGNSRAGVEAVYRIKAREAAKPLILLLDDVSRLSELGIHPAAPVAELLKTFWPGPLTGIFPFAGSPRLRAFSQPTLGIRVPDHPELRAFLRGYPGFLLTTSANLSGEPPIFDPQELENLFSDQVAWMVDGGKLPLSEPSTVADMGYWPPRVLRAGKAKW